MPNLNDLLLASGNPLQDPMFIMVLIICIILIILSAIIGTILGRKRKAEVEARIAERRRQRRLVLEEAAQREKDMLKRYEDAKKKAEQEMISNPRPLLPVPDIKDEEMRPVPRGGERVELLRTTGPRYMKVQGELGVRGSAPVRLSTRDTVGVQGSRFTDTGEAQAAAKVAKAKPVAGTKPGPPKPAVAVAKPAVAKEEPAIKDVSPKPGPVTQGPPKPDLEAAKKEEYERQRLEKEKAEKEKAAKKPTEEEDKGVDRIQEMLTNLDKMK